MILLTSGIGILVGLTFFNIHKFFIILISWSVLLVNIFIPLLYDGVIMNPLEAVLHNIVIIVVFVLTMYNTLEDKDNESK